MTNYDVIAEEYKQSKTLPWRTYVEKFTLMHIVGFIAGQNVVDLACGEGYYTRRLQQCGVAAVSGVDLSEGMIQLAVAEERSRPRGIEYRVKDISDLCNPHNIFSNLWRQHAAQSISNIIHKIVNDFVIS